MAERWRAAVAMLLLAVGLGGVLGVTLVRRPDTTWVQPADLVACRAALRAQFYASIDRPVPGQRPVECIGASDAQLQRLMGEIISEYIDGK